MSEQGEELKERTKRFALEILELVKLLPATDPGPTIRRQLTKSATSVAANYRATRRARSHAEFTARMGMVAEEADESLFWLNLIIEGRLLTAPLLQELQGEANELVAIFSACVGTARRRRRG